MGIKKTPFFSIVIPTKNRPEYLRDSIQSVLLQDFDDYELIVSDNFNDGPTQRLIAEFGDYERFFSFRTDKELNMIDHWEFATTKARGRHVILLADRKVLFNHSLKKLKRIITKAPDINVFSFGIKVYDDQQNKMGWDAPIGKTKRYSSKELISNFLSKNIYTAESMDLVFPKTLNGCFKNAYAKNLREQYGNYFNNKGVTTPDYSSMFVNLALNQEILYVGEKIILTQGEHISNGRHFGAGKYKAYMESLGLKNVYKDVVIKAPMIYNLLIVDFKTVAQLFGGNLVGVELDWKNYFTTTYWDLLVKKKRGLEESELSFFRREWEKGLNEVSSQADIVNTSLIEQSFESNGKAVKKWDKLINFRRHFKEFFGYRFPNSLMEQKMLKFKSCLEAAGFDVKGK